MPGGDRDAYQYLKPIFEAIAAKADGVACVAYMGNGAAGHYVKMVHNGIEYAMMQLISEVYDVLMRGLEFNNEQLYQTFTEWNKGQLQSFLLSVTAEVFRTKDEEANAFLIDLIMDQAGSKGTGKWTSQEAMNLPVSIPTIDAAVAARTLSVYKAQRVKAAALYRSNVRKLETSRETALNELENSLYFSFLIAYAQGFSMLAKASEVHSMNIPLPDVVKVWKAGCIIRSSLLWEFSNAFSNDEKLVNLLLDPTIASIVKEKEEQVRKLLSELVHTRIPAPAMMSTVSYFDAYRTERLPVNLIQAQRDFFGAHTYERIDRSGVFHTEWHNKE
jgi:6-phosphogluconate dehydrogenase